VFILFNLLLLLLLLLLSLFLLVLFLFLKLLETVMVKDNLQDDLESALIQLKETSDQLLYQQNTNQKLKDDYEKLKRSVEFQESKNFAYHSKIEAEEKLKNFIEN
jgi:hypothetical protein